MGASLTMIDRHYGHLVRDGREHAIRLLESYGAGAVDVGGRSVEDRTVCRARLFALPHALDRRHALRSRQRPAR
jgi:hypothetical protein